MSALAADGVGPSGRPTQPPPWGPREVRFMGYALEQARQASERQEVPVGCVLVRGEEVVATGSNRTNETRNATKHAELVAYDAMLARCGGDPSLIDLSSCELFVTCEPCIMCAAALAQLRVRRVYFGCANDKFGGCGSVLGLHATGTAPCGRGAPRGPAEGPRAGDREGGGGEASEAAHYPPSEAETFRGFECYGGLCAAEAIDLFKAFYAMGNPNAPKPHRPLRPRSGAALSGLS